MGPLAPGNLCPRCPHRRQALEGSDLDPPSPQQTLALHLVQYNQDLHEALGLDLYSLVQLDLEVLHPPVVLWVLGALWVLVGRAGMNHRVPEDLEDLYPLEDLYNLEDPAHPGLWSPCPPSLLSVHPVHEVPMVQEDLGVLGSPAVLEDHQHPLYQEDLEDPNDLWDPRDRLHLIRPVPPDGQDLLCILFVLDSR